MDVSINTYRFPRIVAVAGAVYLVLETGVVAAVATAFSVAAERITSLFPLLGVR
jgi:hypothetical protein